MTAAERLELVRLARGYARGLEAVGETGVRGIENSTNVIVSAELLRQLADVLEGASCLDIPDKTSRQPGSSSSSPASARD